MKLKTLVIKNIASIENETIEFDGDKLGNQDLFLICGPTGSGKTTILDAICLALFNKTPRIEGASKKDEINAFATDSDTPNKLNSPLHLVRKNAVDASVTLTFEADGHVYTAKWQVYRNGQYRNGVLSKKFKSLTLEEQIDRKLNLEWTLTDDEGHEYSKYVDKEIVSVIKMSYDQFCKTTMLAQGDFTKFLVSTADEKAQILERMVGTEQYAAVGHIINRTYNDKKNELDVLTRELASYVFLTDEQITEKQQEIAELTIRIKSLAEKKADTDRQIQWITEYVRAAETETNAKNNLDTAEQQLNADDTKQMQSTINLWDTTSDVRESLMSLRQCDDDERIAKSQEERLRTEYITAVAGQQQCIDQRQQLTEANTTLATEIETQKEYEAMFDKVDVICSKHDAIEANSRFIVENEPQIKTFDAAIAELQSKIQELNEQKEQANAEIEGIEKQIKEYTENLNEYGAETIDDEINKLNSLKESLLKLIGILKIHENARTEYTAKLKDRQEAETELTRLESEEEKANDKAQQANKSYTECREICDKAYLSLNDHARALRAKLNAGDDCPVCGRAIEHLLDETELRNILKPLEEKCQSAEKAAQEAGNALAQIKAQIKTTAKALHKSHEDEKNAQSKLQKSEIELKECCASVNISYDDNIASAVSDMMDNLEKKESELTQRNKAIKEINAQIQMCTDKISTIRRLRIAPFEKKLAETQKAKDKQSQKKAQIVGAIELAKSAIESDRATLAELTNPDWQPHNQTKYLPELKAAAKKYADSKRAYNDNDVSINNLTRDLDLITVCQQSILALFPAWSQIVADTVIQKTQGTLSHQWSQLNTDSKLLAKTIHDITEKRKAANITISLYTSNQPEHTLSEVESLLSLTANDIASIRNTLATIIEARSKAKALYDDAVKRKTDLAQGKEMAGLPSQQLEELKQTLVAESESLLHQSNECAEQKGSRQKELETDEQNRRLHGAKKALLDAKRIEYAEWDKLNTYFGSTDGKKFRYIANSFILAELLDKANAYLSNISSRYQLFCHPGTLTIMMRDAYQGGIERTTNTLSGGECFIISLSLALGLSSMQNVDFEVDTLFIDEGFGTLSPEYLDPVITTLKNLHQTYGRRVGIISHVESLKQVIPATIEVKRNGRSASRITVTVN